MKRGLRWFFEHLLGHVATWPVIALIAGLYGKVSGSNDAVTSYIAHHPVRTSVALILLGLVSALGYRAWKIVREYVRLREIVNQAGLSGYWAHSTPDEKAADWTSCANEIGNSQTNDLRILGATGWETFGSPQSPLHKTLKDFHGEIKILLISPDCDTFKERARALHINEADYAQEIQDSIAYCAQLKKLGKSITVKQYKQTPIWKMIFTNNYLWLQYYHPSKHVDNTPVYTFFSNKSHTSLYHPLIDVFRKRWDRDKNPVLSLGDAAG